MAVIANRAVAYFAIFVAFCVPWFLLLYTYQQLANNKNPLPLTGAQGDLKLFISLQQNELERDSSNNFLRRALIPDLLLPKAVQQSTAAVTLDLMTAAPNISTNWEKSHNPFKVILMWNMWAPHISDELLVKGRCPVKSCVFTEDMSLIGQSDVVVLHFDTLEDFPVDRKPHQRFVFYHFESASPDNTDYQLLGHPRFRYNYFNWTMTYRRDSDIFLRDYYGSVVPKTFTNDSNFKPSKGIRVNHNWITAPGEPATQADLAFDYAALIKRKTKMVAWFAGHCTTPIRREEYVRQLSQYVTVDIYGACGKQKCPISCDEMLRNDYKFYLAFENSWCPDYVTEKFIRPFLFDAVPIVLGGANYSRFAPPHSYVNARDYKSPKELAAYLLMLNESESLYSRYFDWKNSYDVYVPDFNGWCELCRMAHDESLPAKTYSDILTWWRDGEGGCENNSSKYF